MEAGKRAPKLFLTDVDMDIEQFLSGRRGVLQTPPSVQFERWKTNTKGRSTALLQVTHTTGRNMEFTSRFTVDKEECCRLPPSAQFEGCKIHRRGGSTALLLVTHTICTNTKKEFKSCAGHNVLQNQQQGGVHSTFCQ